MDNFYLLFIILAILWVGFCILRLVKVFQKMLDLKEQEWSMKIADSQMKIRRDNANLALSNDLRGLMRSVYKRYFEEKEDPEEDPEEEKDKNTK